MALTERMCMESSKPVCDYCEHTVPENFWYVINGDVICKGCLNENFRQRVNEDSEDGDEDE